MNKLEALEEIIYTKLKAQMNLYFAYGKLAGIPKKDIIKMAKKLVKRLENET